MALGLPRGWLRDTAALYARVFRRGAGLALRNWWVGLVVIVYDVLLGIVAVVTAPLGVVGGLLTYLALVACFSSWLALVAQVIQTGRIRLEDVPTSFATYFGDLLNVGFVFWGLQLIWTYVLAPVPFVQIVFGLAVFVFLNAVPELVYVGRHAAAEVLVESYTFISENWIEWFPANVLLLACVLGVLQLPDGPFGLLGAGPSASCSTSRRSCGGCSSRSCRRRAGAGGSSGGARRGRAVPASSLLVPQRAHGKQSRPHLPVLRLEEALRVDRGHAARAGGGHRLAVARVLHVAAGEDAGEARLRRARPGHDVAALVHLELACEELRVGLVADGDEEALGLERAALVGACVLDHHAGDPAVLRLAQDLAHHHVPPELDLRVPPGAVLHDLGGAQLVAAVEHAHARGVLGQEVRLLHGRVAAAHHHHVLLLEEEAVAGGAGRDAVPHERLLGGEAEELGRGAGGDDERLGALLPAVHGEPEGARREVGGGHVAVEVARPEARRLLLEDLHHLGAEDAVGETGIVLDVGRNGELAARLRALDDRGAQVGARGVERGGQAGGAGAEDQHAMCVRIGHGEAAGI